MAAWGRTSPVPRPDVRLRRAPDARRERAEKDADATGGDTNGSRVLDPLTAMTERALTASSSDAAHETRGQLASILESIPDAAMLVSRERRILAVNQRYRSAFTGGREIRGRRCFEVVHAQDRPCSGLAEICPLDWCAATGARVRCLHVHAAERGPLYADVVMRPLVDETGRAEAFLEIARPLAAFRRRIADESLAGVSPAFDRLLGEVERLAAGECPVLIVGEPGTGKEQIGRVLHELGPRRAGPFVPVDCGSLREPGQARELVELSPGSLQASARGGTLFLKEIESLADGAVTTLLAALSGRPLGGADAGCTPADDARLVCSCCLRPEELARSCQRPVRLLAELGDHVLYVPSLRERIDDLPLLVDSLLGRLRYGDGRRRLAPTTLDVLRDYPFPGNLRELAALLEGACVLAWDGLVLPEHLPPAVRRRSAEIRRRRAARLRPPRPT
jgi:two-component system response regulator HydG